jgi:molybdate transport repressor ModE-like protein
LKDANLTLIQTFYFVAREGSFSGGARRLNLSYQSAANHVRRLEQSLGYKLVNAEQGARNSVLTPQGKKLYQLLLPEFDTMLERLNRVIEAEMPVIRIGLPQAYFYYLFPALMARFEEKFPGSEIVCYERDAGLVDMVRMGYLDVFIAERTVPEKEVRQTLLGSYRLVLLYPASWPSPAAGGLREWANDRPFITYETGHIIRNMALDQLSDGELAPRLSISTSGSSSVMRCVEEGLGFAVVPEWITAGLPESVQKYKLSDWPTISVYFGEAGFLEKNVYVNYIKDLCKKAFQKNLI